MSTPRRRTVRHEAEWTGDGYTCQRCRKFYKTKPGKADCQGIPNYQIRKERPDHLFTINELAMKGLQPGSDCEPEGYVQMRNAPYWVYLYDIGKAVKRKSPDEQRADQGNH